jgi:hypothetical protein
MSTGLQTLDADAAAIDARARGLLADLAADPGDLIDAATALGAEFRNVVADFLGGQASTDDLIGPLAALTSSPALSVPRPERPPFVWVRILPSRRGDATARAGWLTPAALWAIVGEARAASRGARLEIIIPLDSGDAAVGRVRALCAGLAGDDLEIVVQAQGESEGAKMRWSWGAVKWRRGGEARARASRGTSYRATWVAFGSAVGDTP